MKLPSNEGRGLYRVRVRVQFASALTDIRPILLQTFPMIDIILFAPTEISRGRQS